MMDSSGFVLLAIMCRLLHPTADRWPLPPLPCRTLAAPDLRDRAISIQIAEALARFHMVMEGAMSKHATKGSHTDAATSTCGDAVHQVQQGSSSDSGGAAAGSGSGGSRGGGEVDVWSRMVRWAHMAQAQQAQLQAEAQEQQEQQGHQRQQQEQVEASSHSLLDPVVVAGLLEEVRD